ncbi:hypothetical protein [Yersinia phage fHe-Yen9-04]|uniref:Uncharacterized protein n=1 Tax=Yersinia phage fHe-Yen9-04 TaxID=2052742 RepID=A0A2C9CY08_9CAUD|nr:hypothetical protein FDJ41_gp459 [Yersinia phage fHe-Yen9-04]SOK58721.1 hypothetical protein [Yersinia phage fHe-Yen9-04]VUE36490.1 hypothetical protein [Yersinia phage fHe-Yen9-04]
MKSATALKNMNQRIQTLRSQRDLAWSDWSKLNSIETKTKDESKDLSKISGFISKLNYEIRGLELSFNELKKQVIDEIILS